MSNNVFEELTKSFGNFGQFNAQAGLEDAAEAVRNNFEAIVAANTALVEGAQAVAQRQVKALQAGAEEAIEFAKDIASSKDPKEGAAKQAEFAKAAFEKSLAEGREQFEIASQSGNKAAEVIGKQVTQNIRQFSDATQNAAKQAKQAAKKAA